ncbi:hypothetical protein [Kouleothrix sp.]|uniref:hypothetical protein n=1 Tax=Kouleothrix sp. TaxID=2779161 RepID=UPI003919826A
MNINLSIDSIILHGLDTDRHAVAAAVERELGRLLAERGLPPELAANDGAISVALPEVRVPRGLRPDAIGARVAESIYASVAGAPGEPLERGTR